jgi:release factor glutamine methyltransferase
MITECIQNSTTIRELFEEVQMILKTAKVEESRLNTEWILWESLGLRDRAEVYLSREKTVSEEKRAMILNHACKRAQGVPLQYLFNSTEFFSLKMRISPACLIPRPETEILVEHAIGWLQSQPVSSLKILDIGTGSGNIAIAVAKNVPGCKILAIDISKETLKVAQQNIEFHRSTSQIELMTHDILDGLKRNDLFDLIVSNPPYIDEKEWSNLPEEVRFYEPKTALNGGKEGMEVISKIIKQAPLLLRKGGALMMEFSGSKQTPAIRKVFDETEGFHNLEIVKDYSFEDRVVKAIYGSPHLTSSCSTSI